MKIIFSLLTLVGLLVASVDINTATSKELTSLSGIGKSKAEAIVKYRTIKCFKTVDELVKVKGIGKKLLDKNKENITASKCK